MKLKQVFFAFLLVSLHFTSCSDGEDGANGINCWDTNGDGIEQENEDVNGDNEFDFLDCMGTQGTQGDPGTPCWDLNNNGQPDITEDKDTNEDINGDNVVNALDCRGADGQQGEDGNANVQRWVIDVTEVESQVNLTDSFNIEGFDQNPFPNYVFLTWLETNGVPIFDYVQIPAIISGAGYSPVFSYDEEDKVIEIQISISENGWIPIFTNLHVVAVETSTTMGGKTSQDTIWEDLKKSGVAIEDYHAVMAYFGMK
ncbi:MAG: hypothetical protein AAF575_13125 [Bacteroidota bacterium]